MRRVFYVLLHNRIWSRTFLLILFLLIPCAISKKLVTFAAMKGSRWFMPALHYPVWL